MFIIHFRRITYSTLWWLVKCLPAMGETRVQSLGWEDPLEKEMATPSSTLAWKTPWTEEPGRLQSTGLQRVRHDWATSLKKPSLWVCLVALKLEGVPPLSSCVASGRPPPLSWASACSEGIRGYPEGRMLHSWASYLSGFPEWDILVMNLLGHVEGALSQEAC